MSGSVIHRNFTKGSAFNIAKILESVYKMSFDFRALSFRYLKRDFSYQKITIDCKNIF